MVQNPNKNQMQKSMDGCFCFMFLFFFVVVVHYLPLCRLKSYVFFFLVTDTLVCQATVLGTGFIDASLSEKPSSVLLLQFVGPTLTCDVAKFLATNSVITRFSCVLQSLINQLEHPCFMLERN